MNKKLLIAISTIVVLALGAASYFWFFAADFKEVASLIVNQEGGEISSKDNNIKITIPNGALKEGTEVLVEEGRDVEVTGLEQASPVYQITGLMEICQPVTVQIRTTEPLSGDTYVALGGEACAKSKDEPQMEFIYLPAEVQDGLVEFTIPAQTSENLLSKLLDSFQKTAYAADEKLPSTPVLQAVVVTNLQTSQTTSRFNIIAPANANTVDIEYIESYLEYCYEFYENMGFTKLSKYEKWPMDIYIKDIDNSGGFWNFGYWKWITVNQQALANTPKEVSRTLIHEFFHFVQSLYGEDDWLDEATAVWAEQYDISGADAYVPALYRKYGEKDLMIFNGPINHSGRADDIHGYGSWAFIKYLVPSPQQGAQLVKIYENIDSYNSEVEILNAFRPVKVNEWINDFYLALLTKKVHPDTNIGVMQFRQKEDLEDVTIDLSVQSNPQEFTTTSAIEIPEFAIPGLAARGIMIRLNTNDAATIPPGISLAVETGNDNCTVNFIRTSGNPSEILATQTGAASIGKLNILAGDKMHQQVMALITNTSEEDVDITVKFELKDVPELDDLVGDDWTDGQVTVTKAFLDTAEFEKYQEEGNCDQVAAASIIEMLQSMEGQTYPSHLRIVKTGDNTGQIQASTDYQKKNQFKYEETGYDFEYKDGKIEIATSIPEGDLTWDIKYDLSASYRDDNIIVSGKNYMVGTGGTGSSAPKLFDIEMEVEYKIPLPQNR